MKKKKDDEGKRGIVESFLGGIPMFGDFFKELGKTETFKEKFKEVNEKIEENLEKGQKKRWGLKTSISVRPITHRIKTHGIKKDDTEIAIEEDYFYEKKGNKLILAVKVPEDNMDLKINGKNLLITSDNTANVKHQPGVSSKPFEKKIELPGYYRNIKIKQCKKEIIVLELTK